MVFVSGHKIQALKIEKPETYKRLFNIFFTIYTMSQSEEGDNSFMAMLNNPVINPGPVVATSTSKKTEGTRLKPCSFPAVQDAEKKLTSATKDVYLSSESDEPFQLVNTSTDKDTLPTTVKELVQLGLIDEEEEQGQLKIKSMQEFLQEDQYEKIIKAFKEIEPKSDDSKVYLLGEESVTVLILCIVKDKQGTAIVGLKSLLVQT